MTEETPDDRMKRLLTGQFNKPLPRRFYKAVEVSHDNAILLDGKPVRTPMKNTLSLPTRKLAEAVAAEWLAQDKVIDPAAMPLTKLSNTALDRASAERAHVLQEVLEYAGSDLVCYWADRPPDLVVLQHQHWQPVLHWARDALGASFTTARGISHVAQPAAALDAIQRHVAAHDPWSLTATYLAMTLTGSALLALMLQAGATSADTIWAAAHVDEDYQISQWGEDHEAATRRKHRQREFQGIVQFRDLLAP